MMFNARRLKMNRSAFSALFVAAALAGNLPQCDRANDQFNRANCVAACRGEPHRASDGRKAGCDYARGAAGRSPANRFEPSKV